MIECVILASEDQEFAHCKAIRMEVFVDEQRVPPHEELDDFDEVAVHLLALVDGEPVGTARLLFGEEGLTRIGRMAVRQPHRGQGVGAAMLNRLLGMARGSGARSVILDAQLHAIPFYERFGFIAEGDIFTEAGIEHRVMTLVLL
jgi:predicted GNAT family N-acyltransferase